MIRRPVPADLAGERVDKIVAELAGISRARARAMVDGGEVTVDGLVVAVASTRPAQGAMVEFPEPVEAEAMEGEPVDFEVLWEDDQVVVVDKPAGVVVHPGAGRRRGTLAAGLLHRFPELEGVGEPGRWGLIHRLDRDTSGVLLVARTGEAYRRLSADLHRRRIGRHYLTLVAGTLDIDQGTIEAPIGSDPSDPRRRKVVVGGRPARTHYRVVERLRDATLLAVTLETGRTHQIRVHMQAIDHPVIGDPWYGRPWRVTSPRVFLHAHRIEFDHPVGGERIEVVSPLPVDLTEVLDSLRREG